MRGTNWNCLSKLFTFLISQMRDGSKQLWSPFQIYDPIIHATGTSAKHICISNAHRTELFRHQLHLRSWRGEHRKLGAETWGPKAEARRTKQTGWREPPAEGKGISRPGSVGTGSQSGLVRGHCYCHQSPKGRNEWHLRSVDICTLLNNIPIYSETCTHSSVLSSNMILRDI